MNAREVSWRVFAEEYNSSTMEHTGEGDKPVSYIVTPLGARVNRLHVVGVVTRSQPSDQIMMEAVGAAVVEFGKGGLLAPGQPLSLAVHPLSTSFT